VARELYAALVGVAQPQLKNAQHLLIVPGGELFSLPFQALKNPQGRYLVESVSLSTLAQADLLPTRAASPARLSRLLALGNPDGSLPAAAREVKDIGKLFTRPEVYCEGQATLAQLARKRAAPQVVHLATHGLFNGLDPKESALILAGRPSRLSVRDLLEGSVRLNFAGNRLVTLSACQTHLGGNDPSVLYGSLSRAFAQMGAPAVVASLWSVEDEATRQLMLEFYSGLTRGLGRAAALARAQRKMIGTRDYAHPYFWAPFVLLGDWR